MNILIACEFSGTVRDAFRRRGHHAVSCDILPTEKPGPHYQGDVCDILGMGWDMLIAHPPCTYLANSGCRHLHTDPSRWQRMFEGADFFRMLHDSPIPMIAVENPIPHKYARAIIGTYDQIVQPWMFGHGEVKATCFWLKNLPPLAATNVVDGRVPKVHWEPPGPDRWKRRSLTYQGIADAMADQWG